MNFLNVDKGITTLAMNINLKSYMETLKIGYYKHYKLFTTFQRNITNKTIRIKHCWQNVIRQRKQKSIDKFSCVKERKNCWQQPSKLVMAIAAANLKFIFKCYFIVFKSIENWSLLYTFLNILYFLKEVHAHLNTYNTIHQYYHHQPILFTSKYYVNNKENWQCQHILILAHIFI